MDVLFTIVSLDVASSVMFRLPACDRSSPVAKGDDLTILVGAEPARSDGSFVDDECALAGRVREPSVHVQQFPVGKQGNAPVRAVAVIGFQALEVRQRRRGRGQQARGRKHGLRILFEVVPAVHPVHADAEHAELVADAIFVPQPPKV